MNTNQQQQQLQQERTPNRKRTWWPGAAQRRPPSKQKTPAEKVVVERSPADEILVKRSNPVWCPGAAFALIIDVVFVVRIVVVVFVARIVVIVVLVVVVVSSSWSTQAPDEPGRGQDAGSTKRLERTMTREFSLAVLRLVVGHICQNVGWHSLQQSSLTILVDILQRYLIELGKCTQAFANGAGRTESNTEDVFLAFNDFGITESDLLDYLLNVDSLPFPKKLPTYPVQQPAQLCFPKVPDPHRPECIPSYLPAIRPESEILAATALSNGAAHTSDANPTTDDEAADQQQVQQNQQQQANPASPQVDNGVKRSDDNSAKANSNKKGKALPEEGTPMCEVIFIQMTPSGFLSAIRDGRLPDPSYPSKLLLDPRTSEHENSSDDEPIQAKTVSGSASTTKATGKKRKRGGKSVAESKVDKFFDEKVPINNNNNAANSTKNSSNNNVTTTANNNGSSNINNTNGNSIIGNNGTATVTENNINSSGSLVTSIKLDKQAVTVKEKKVKDKEKVKEIKDPKDSKDAKVSKDNIKRDAPQSKIKKGKKRKNLSGARNPKGSKQARMGSPAIDDRATARKTSAGSNKSTTRAESAKLAAAVDEVPTGHSKKSDSRHGAEVDLENDSQSVAKIKLESERQPTPPPVTPPVKLKVSKAEREQKERRAKEHRDVTSVSAAVSDAGSSAKGSNKDSGSASKESPVAGGSGGREIAAAPMATTTKERKTELMRAIDDAISTVIENARRSVSERSPVDERGRKKLQVSDIFDLSDSEPEHHHHHNRGGLPHSEDDIDVIDRPKTPDLSPSGSGDGVFSSMLEGSQRSSGNGSNSGFRDFGTSELRPSKSKASPLEELARQIPLRIATDHQSGSVGSSSGVTQEPSSMLLTPSVTITPVPPTPTIPPLALVVPTPATPTLTVKTLAEKKGLPPLEVEQVEKAKKKKDKRKDKKDKKAGGKKKEVPKLMVKLSSAASFSEPLFAPTALITTTVAPVAPPPPPKDNNPPAPATPTPTTTTTPSQKEPTTKGGHKGTKANKAKNSLLRAMVTEVESDNETPLPPVEKVSLTTKTKGGRNKEPKEPKEPPPKKETKAQQAKSAAAQQQQTRSPKKEKQTPPKVIPPLPPILSEITITPIPAPSTSKKDKKKEKPVKEAKKRKAEKEETEPKPKVKDIKPEKPEKPIKLSKAALKEEPKELKEPKEPERAARSRKEHKDHEKEHPPATVKKESGKKDTGKASKEKAASQESQVEVVTVGTILDAEGNKIWICPACAKPDDGSPMIGCDQCDDWYHWECVGISVPPSEEEQWFCVRCTKLKVKPHKKHRR